MGQCFLVRRGGTANTRRPPDFYEYLAAYQANAVWTVPADGWYRVFCYGRSGNGGAGARGGQSSNYSYTGGNGGSGAGGNSGGASASVYYLKKDEVHNITISDALTGFDDEMYATAGANGGNGSVGESGGTTGGMPDGARGVHTDAVATAVGGNLANASGFMGGDGGGRGGYPSKGGNNGGSCGEKDSRIGGGGARYNYEPPFDVYMLADEEFILNGPCSGGRGDSAGQHAYDLNHLPLRVSGAGGGGGGGEGTNTKYTPGNGGAGGAGMPGLVIIEKGGYNK